MSKRYLRNRVDGFIYDWNEILSKNPKCEEVTEEVAFPERFIPKGLAAARAMSEAKIILDTDSIPEKPPGNPDINKDASKGIRAGSVGLRNTK